MRWMNAFACSLLLIAVVAQGRAQSEGEVDNVRLHDLSATSVRLSWLPITPACGESVTYSVYRGESEDFDVTDSVLLVSDLTGAAYTDRGLRPHHDYYYRVFADRIQGKCVPHTGVILVAPLDLGERYTVSVGDKTELCSAVSTSELNCPSLPSFHAVIASQGIQDFLLGCLSTDFDDNAWSCVNLQPMSAYRIAVHSNTVVVLDAGLSKVDMKTGKALMPITPEFSVLSVLK